MSREHSPDTVNQFTQAQAPSASQFGERRPTLNDQVCALEHHLSCLRDHVNAMDYHGLRKRLCEDILPLVSRLEDTVNRH